MPEQNIEKASENELMRMTAQMVSAYVANNMVPASQIPDVIRSVYGTLTGIGTGAADSKTATQKPVVSIKKSVTPDYIICLEDGKKLKMLKRHLRSTYSLSPDEYRAKWGLPSDYPMVAPNYAKQRSAFAKKIGLGRSATGRRSRKS